MQLVTGLIYANRNEQFPASQPRGRTHKTPRSGRACPPTLEPFPCPGGRRCRADGRRAWPQAKYRTVIFRWAGPFQSCVFSKPNLEVFDFQQMSRPCFLVNKRKKKKQTKPLCEDTLEKLLSITQVLLCPGPGQRLDPKRPVHLLRHKPFQLLPWELQRVLAPPRKRGCADPGRCAGPWARSPWNSRSPRILAKEQKATSSRGEKKTNKWLMLCSPSFLNSV